MLETLGFMGAVYKPCVGLELSLALILLGEGV